MAYPTVEGVTTGASSTNLDTHTITLPSSIASGELILILVCHDDHEPDTTVTGYTRIALIECNSPAGTVCAFHKTAAGGETTATLNINGNEGAAWIAYRISGWSSIEAGTFDESTSGGATTFDGGSGVSPSWGSADSLYINCIGAGAPDQVTTWTDPSGWSDQSRAGDSYAGGAFIVAARKESTATSENPGNWDSNSDYANEVGRGTLVIEPAAAGSTISPADCTHSHTADSPTLASTTTISPADATHSHSADSPTLTASSTIGPGDASHFHAADSPTLTASSTISPADATHGHVADSPTLTSGLTISPARATHGHTADSPTLSASSTLSPDDASHSHDADSPTLVSGLTISPADCTHGHTADSPTLTATTSLSPDDATHSHTADNVTLTSGLAISPADCTHSHTADQPTLTATSVIVPADCLHSHLADQVVLTSGSLSPNDCLHTHTADQVVLAVAGGGGHGVEYELPNLAQHYELPNLAQHYELPR